MNLYLDFDGVIADTIKPTYKMLEDEGISLNDKERVSKFYKELNWFELLKKVGELNNSISDIKMIKRSDLYKLYILTTVNSLDEISAKINFIRSNNLDIPLISVPKGTDKSKLVSAKGSILVDDYSGNLSSWEKDGGIGVKFDEEKESDKYITIKALKELKEDKFIKKLIKKI